MRKAEFQKTDEEINLLLCDNCTDVMTSNGSSERPTYQNIIKNDSNSKSKTFRNLIQKMSCLMFVTLMPYNDQK